MIGIIAEINVQCIDVNRSTTYALVNAHYRDTQALLQIKFAVKEVWLFIYLSFVVDLFLEINLYMTARAGRSTQL